MPAHMHGYRAVLARVDAALLGRRQAAGAQLQGRGPPRPHGYGSGRKLAQDAQLKLTVDKRAGDKTFADYVQAGKANFGAAAEAFIAPATGQ